MQINIILNIINIVVIAVAFLIIFIHQRNQNKTLKTHIDTLKGTIDSIRIISDLLDPQKVKGHIELSEDRVRKEMEKQMREMKDEYKKELSKLKTTADKVVWTRSQLMTALQGLVEAFFYIPQNLREKILNNMNEKTMVFETLQSSALKAMLKKHDELGRQLAMETLAGKY